MWEITQKKKTFKKRKRKELKVSLVSLLLTTNIKCPVFYPVNQVTEQRGTASIRSCVGVCMLQDVI